MKGIEAPAFISALETQKAGLRHEHIRRVRTSLPKEGNVGTESKTESIEPLPPPEPVPSLRARDHIVASDASCNPGNPYTGSDRSRDPGRKLCWIKPSVVISPNGLHRPHSFVTLRD